VLPDADVRRFVQKFAGYSITGDVSAQALAFLWGGGSNGKTTFLETLREVVGGYAYQAGGDLLVSKRERGAGELAAMAKLRGRRFVTTVEVDDGKRMAEGLVKELTGERTINAKLMRQNPVEFVNVSKVWLAANHKPEVRGQDWAMWRRIRLVPFTVTIPDHEKDEHLGAKLLEERDGILAWLVAGCLLWQAEGLKPPEAVMAATAQYREESNPLQDWIEERCELAAEAETPFSDLREDYLNYCKRESIRLPLRTKAFGNALKEHDLEATKGTGGVRMRQGVRLRGSGMRF
jgi:putative DNA primase/helicase